MPGDWSNKMQVTTLKNISQKKSYFKNFISQLFSLLPKQVVLTKKAFQPSTKPDSINQQCAPYIVKSGDSLWNIANKFMGDGSQYTVLMNKNGLTSPVITPGQKITTGC